MLNLMPNWIGITICTACWLIAAFGIIFQPWLMKKSDKLNTCLYLFQGWLVLFAFKPVVEALPVTGLALLVAGRPPLFFRNNLLQLAKASVSPCSVAFICIRRKCDALFCSHVHHLTNSPLPVRLPQLKILSQLRFCC